MAIAPPLPSERRVQSHAIVRILIKNAEKVRALWIGGIEFLLPCEGTHRSKETMLKMTSARPFALTNQS